MYIKKILHSVYSSLLQHYWQLQLLGHFFNTSAALAKILYFPKN